MWEKEIWQYGAGSLTGGTQTCTSCAVVVGTRALELEIGQEMTVSKAIFAA